MKYSSSFPVVALLLLNLSLFAQSETIQLVNPSFEGIPADGTVGGALPSGWRDCGFPGETAPDVHPQIGGGAFQVDKEPFDGKTYIGMVVRENDTWEMISQRLSAPLKKGQCYEFSMYLCRSELYVSPSRVSAEKVNYTTPVKLRIWGGAGYCDRSELLAESPLIVNTRWLPYDFRFEPKQNYTYLVFEVFYKTPTPFPYNGNILLDQASAIRQIPCQEPPLIAQNTPKKEPPRSTKRVAEKTPEPKNNKILKDLDRSKLTKGQVIRIERLYFLADSPEMIDSSYTVLDEIYDFLKENADVVIEIGGHTNSFPEDDYCDRLSTARAKSVVDFLKTKGIPSQQLTHKGYGKRRPVAPNTTAEGRKRNQRVEIKVLSFNS
jgi:outer membrane protein OmpA-like peptidoglycan-associated protein